eukprot:14616918-Alexandrium_andersonii.AAC.1
MSASLVGSEMCIRDRSWAAWRVAWTAAGLTSVPSTWIASCIGWEAISCSCLLYTSDAADDM